MRKLRLKQGPEGAPNFCFGLYRLDRNEATGRFESQCIQFVQSDWEYPNLASSFGWSINYVQRCAYCGKAYDCHTPGADEGCDENDYCHHDRADACDHEGDGTVNCRRCGLTVSDFLSHAFDWLEDRDGEEIPDSGN